jgi:hypothetical protein
MARLRHAAVQRHVGVRAKPAVGIFGKHQGGAAGARKRLAVGMISGARPRRDRDRRQTIGGRQNRGLLKDETEVGGLRPDIVPLRRDPFVQAGEDIVVRTEGKHVGVEQRPRRGVVDLADVAREGFQPLAEELSQLRVRGRQRVHGLLHIWPCHGRNLIAPGLG